MGLLEGQRGLHVCVTADGFIADRPTLEQVLRLLQAHLVALATGPDRTPVAAITVGAAPVA